MRRLIIVLIAILSFPVQADCLADLRHSAHVQRACLVTQSRVNECDAVIHATAQMTAQCQVQGYAAAQTTYAVQQGFAEVIGDPERSPYRLALARLRARQQLLTRLDARWNQRWAGILPQVRDDGFDDNECPLAFKGQQDRYLMVADLHLPVRAKLGPDLGNSHPDSEHLYIATMQPGLCFGPAAALQTTRIEADEPGFVYNLSTSDLDLIRQAANKAVTPQLHLHLCGTISDCLAQSAHLQQIWRSYQRHVQQLSASEQCRRYASANASGEIDVAHLYGVDCSTVDKAGTLQKEQSESQAEAQQLFGP